MIALDEFLNLSNEEVAQLVRDAGPRVCVFPINGTRRWFRLEHGDTPDAIPAYLDAMVDVHIRLCRLLFEHGLDTLVIPVFGPELLHRNGYQEIALKGLSRLAADPSLREFYSANDIRVRFYGDYANHFQEPPWGSLLPQFEELKKETSKNTQRRLFLGAYAQDATGAIARLAIDFHTTHGRAPTREELVEAYYGEYLPPANIFIGFDIFCAFDMPLLDIGETDLYFTVCPSPYLSVNQLREILYDHIYMRRVTSTNGLDSIGYPALVDMQAFYDANLGKTQGIGILRDGIWYPVGRIEIPPEMNE